MNIEQTKEAIRIMQAYVDGKEVQYLGKKRNPMGLLLSDWCDTHEPFWNFEHYDYRIKPTAKLRPWTADEVPLGAQMRTGANGEYRWLIDCSGHNIKRKEWLEEREHSTDGGKTWLPCGVVEEAK
jgi:hypothetical protein